VLVAGTLSANSTYCVTFGASTEYSPIPETLEEINEVEQAPVHVVGDYEEDVDEEGFPISVLVGYTFTGVALVKYEGAFVTADPVAPTTTHAGPIPFRVVSPYTSTPLTPSLYAQAWFVSLSLSGNNIQRIEDIYNEGVIEFPDPTPDEWSGAMDISGGSVSSINVGGTYPTNTEFGTLRNLFLEDGSHNSERCNVIRVVTPPVDIFGVAWTLGQAVAPTWEFYEIEAGS
jgi:hypothetical protein